MHERWRQQFWSGSGRTPPVFGIADVAQLAQATSEVLKMYEDVLASLDESERGKLQRAMGMKMEQLKVPFCIGDLPPRRSSHD